MKQENIDKIVWGGLYRCKISNPCPRYNDRLNDQKYGTWIPVHYEYTNYEGKHKEGYGMVDTYQAPTDISFTNEGVPDDLKGFERLVFKLNRLNEREARCLMWKNIYAIRLKDSGDFNLIYIKCNLIGKT